MPRIRLGAFLRGSWPDWAAAVGLVALFAGLLWAREARWQAAGGLTRVVLAGDRVVSRERVPGVDLYEKSGPWPPASRGHDKPRIRYQGYLYVPYRGQFVLGLWLRGSAVLQVGGARPIRASSGRVTTRHRQSYHPPRLVKEQRLLERGWLPLSLEYTPPAGATQGLLRLLWQPPGRRGDPEYVVSAVLRPAGRAPARAPSAHPTRPDFWFALSLALSLLLALGVWLRVPLMRWIRSIRSDPVARLDLAVTLLVVGTAVAVRLWGLDAAGQTWDEDVYFGAGRNLWENLLSLDFRPESWAWNLEHPPVTKYALGLGALWSESMHGARVVSALAGGITAGVVYLLGRDLTEDRRVGAVAAALVALLPPLVAHGRVAGHESVSVLLWAVTALLGWRGLSGRRPRWGASLGAGVAAGLAVSCRLVNVTVFAMLLGMLIPGVLQRRRDRQAALDRLPHLVALGLVAVATFFLVWPRLWHQPAFHLGELLSYWPPGSGTTELFLGKPTRFHWAYFLVYAGVTTPTAVLLGVGAFGVRLVTRGYADRGRSGDWVIVSLLLAPLLITPLVPFCRDGIRYVLPIELGLALGAAVGALWVLDAILGRFPSSTLRGGRARSLSALVATLAILAGPTAWATVRFHPYLLDYYNLPSGGPRAALDGGRYELSWWGEGLGAGVRYINRHGAPNARVGVDVAARHTMVLLPDMRTVPADPRLRPEYLMYSGDGLRRLWDRRARRWRNPPGYRVVHEERVVGVPLLRIYRRQDPR